MSVIADITQSIVRDHPGWIPFMCLITGKALRKPIVTRIVESLVLGAISAGIMLWVGFNVMQNEVANIKISIERNRTEVITALNRMEDRFAKVEDCVRLRTCTK